MIRFNWVVGILMLAFFNTSAMARDAEIYEPPKILFSMTDSVAPQKIRDRIVAAAQSLGWQFVKEEPDLLELHFDKQKKHQVNIAVHYDSTGYKIEYLNSYNLNFSETGGEKRIHPNYNRWIRNLMKNIGAL